MIDKIKQFIVNNKFIAIGAAVIAAIIYSSDAIQHIEHLFSFLKDKTRLEITSFEISKRHSAYRDISKVHQNIKKYYKPTQFNTPGVRQFNIDRVFVDNLNRSGKEVARIIPLTAAYALTYLHNDPALINAEVIETFETLSDCNQRKEIKNFMFSMVPPARYVPDETAPKSKPYVQFFPEETSSTIAFKYALDRLYNDTKQQNYRVCNKPIGRHSIDVYLEEYIAIFFNGFWPVFEITLHNTGSETALITDISAEVLDIAEYMGGAEYIFESEVQTIKVPYKTGKSEWQPIKPKPISLSADSYCKLLVRLIPSGIESSYKINIRIKASGKTYTTRTVEVDM